MTHLLADIGCALPIIQAPMAGVQDGRLARAVSEAGGLGALPAAMLTPAQLEEALRFLDRHLGRRYLLNFFAHRPAAPDPARSAAWQQRLAPYYTEYGLSPQAAGSAVQRQPFAAASATLVEKYRPAVVSFHFGLPEPALLARVRATGALIWATATTVDEARWLETQGVDAIVAQGLEAGGHRGHFLRDDLDLTGQLGTFALLPQIVAAVRVPVLAAGGVTGPAQVRAARALGAAAVQAGTVYLCSDEATTPAWQRAALHSPAARETALTNLFSGRPARGVVNRLMRDCGPLRAEVPPFPLAAADLAPLRNAAEAAGNPDFSPLWCGQSAHCPARPAAEITRWLAEGLADDEPPAEGDEPRP